MRLVLTLIAATVVLTTILCLWLNSGNKDNKNIEKQKENKKSIMPNWSLENAMKVNRETCNCTSGDVRLGMGLYRTPEESDKYIEESLKRPLP